MRNLFSLLPLSALFAASLSAQIVNVDTARSSLLDGRPFGKYLIQICTLSADTPLTVTCDPPLSPLAGAVPPLGTYSVPPRSDKTAQTITLKLVGCAENVTPCPAPTYPIVDGAPFFVSATADSGLIVDQEVVHGDVMPRNGTRTVEYVAHGSGIVVIRASVRPGQLYEDRYAAAPAVELALTLGADSDPTPATCIGLPATTASQIQPQIDLPGIVTLIGNPNPFVLTPQGNNTVVIYSTRYPLNEKERLILNTLPSDIAQLAGRRADLLGVKPTQKPLQVELQIPHAAALGDLAARISTLNYSQFTVQDIGTDRVRITAATPPDCPTWTAFLSAIRHLEWQVVSEPLAMKLYYLSSTDAATAFATLAAGSSPAASTPSGGATPAAAAPSGSAGSPAGSGAGGAATIAVNQPPGSVFEIKSDTTPCVVAGLATGNSSGCAPASGSGGTAAPSGGAPAAPSAANAAAAAPKPPGMAAMAVAAGIVEQNPSDLLVFSDTNPGDDAQIVERKRILAQLDLPRPEMLINAWVMQNSTANPRGMGMVINTMRDLVEEYNGALEDVVLRGWQLVHYKSKEPGYFDPDYFSYVADRYIADTSVDTPPTKLQDAAQAVLSYSPAKMADSPDDLNKKYGICPKGHYCLGYNGLFHPLKPRLTDLLLTFIAAKRPACETFDAIYQVEHPYEQAVELCPRPPAVTVAPPTHPTADNPPPPPPDDNPPKDLPQSRESPCDKKTLIPELRERCRAIWNNLGLSLELPSNEMSCASQDYREILAALVNNPLGDKKRPQVFLTCFKRAARTYLANVGQLRATVADFLFNYKLSQQYPHEFLAYDLSQSADSLNSALSPIIDAFNRDIIAFQTFMRADVEYRVGRLNSATDERCCVKRLFGLDKPSFFNDGIVSVRTISGQPTQVSTTTQSVLDASTAPSLSNLANAIASPGGSGGTGTSPVAGVLGSPQSPASLLTGVLNAYQTTFAQFGRSFVLSVVPRSLSTASTAEITVTLNYDETAGGPIYSGGPAGGTPPNTSRIANHDISTRIRVDSVKLFEVSSFSAIVQRSRSRFPLLPPFVEIPYIGTVAGIPIPGAKEYHSSIAVMSAMVVPTAADIAYGLRFAFDQVVDGQAGPCSFVKGSAGDQVKNTCGFRRALSMLDLKQNPIVDFHKAMIHCFATNMKSAYSSVGNLASSDNKACTSLSFDGIPQKYIDK